jgi:hypothetical protein
VTPAPPEAPAAEPDWPEADLWAPPAGPAVAAPPAPAALDTPPAAAPAPWSVTPPGRTVPRGPLPGEPGAPRPKRRAVALGLVLGLVVVLALATVGVAVLAARQRDPGAGPALAPAGTPSEPVGPGRPILLGGTAELTLTRLTRSPLGAEPWVRAQFTVTNKGREALDLFLMEATARLGPGQRPVRRLSGSDGISARPSWTLRPGRSNTVVWYFPIRTDADATRVTVEVWPRWGAGPGRFTGPATTVEPD